MELEQPTKPNLHCQDENVSYEASLQKTKKTKENRQLNALGKWLNSQAERCEIVVAN
jgi:hypothetical protein